MSLIHIHSQLRSANKSVHDLEAAVSQSPDDAALSLMLASAAKHRQRLEERFEAESRAQGVDVCNYRAFGRMEGLISGVFRAVLSFQELVTIAFAAIASGQPRKSRRVGMEYVDATSFGFSHAYEGSTGIVLTLQNERLLFGGTKLDEAMDVIFDLAQLTRTEDIRRFADQLGIGVIRQLYAWSSVNTDGELGADIDWRRGSEIRNSVFVEPPQLRELQILIDKTSDKQTETYQLHGTMVGADVAARRFRFLTDDGATIQGAFQDAISESHSVTLPRRYEVRITKTTEVHYSIDEDIVEYFLDEIVE